MGLQDFRIKLDNSNATYYPEQTVTGILILVLNTPKKVRSIKIHVKGAAHTSWTETRTRTNSEGKSETYTVHLTGNEEYFNTKIILFGSPSGDSVEISAGSYTYPFSFILPRNIPSSFESEYGHIRYTVKGIVDRRWKFDHETKRAFTVVSILDLNRLEYAKKSVLIEKSKTLGCFCCASPPLTVTFSLPVRGYVPGQKIPINVNVENHSGTKIYKVEFKLEKRIVFKAEGHTKTNTYAVAGVTKGPIRGNETVSYEQFIRVPPIPPSSLNNCGIIDIDYVLKMTAYVDATCSTNLKDQTIIYIGSIPITNYQMPQPSAPNLEPHAFIPNPSAPEEQPIPMPAAAQYPDIPPPSYEECMYSSSSLRDQGESEHIIGAQEPFAPRYPVYNFMPMPMPSK